MKKNEVEIVKEADALAAEQEALAKKHEKALAKCEATIQRGQAAYMEAAKAVVQIVDQELFRPHYANKKSYFEDRWDIEKQELNRYENAGRVLLDLEDDGYEGDRLPKNESQCRALYALCKGAKVLDGDRLITLWSSVVDGEERITAKLLEQKAKELFGDPQQAGTYESAAQHVAGSGDDGGDADGGLYEEGTGDGFTARVTATLADGHADVMSSSGFDVTKSEDGSYLIHVTGRSKAEILAMLSKWNALPLVTELVLAFV